MLGEIVKAPHVSSDSSVLAVTLMLASLTHNDDNSAAAAAAAAAAAPRKDNPAGLQTMVHLLLISVSQLVVGVLAVLACKSVSNDEVDKLRALFRAMD